MSFLSYIDQPVMKCNTEVISQKYELSLFDLGSEEKVFVAIPQMVPYNNLNNKNSRFPRLDQLYSLHCFTVL